MVNVLRHKTTFVVVGASCGHIRQEGVFSWIDGIRYRNTGTDTHEVIQVSDLPEKYIGGGWCYDSGWYVYSEEAITLVEEEHLRKQLVATDTTLLRVVEDIYEVLTADQKAALPQAAKDKIQARKALRAQLNGG